MKNIEVYNTLNIDKDSSSIVATFTQEDDAVMEFKLFKDGQEIVLKDQTISLGAERKDGAVIEQEDGFLIKENNVLNITLKKNIIQVVGVVKIQLYLKDKSGEMASNTFNIRVNKKLLGAENVEATNDIKSLNTLVLELKNNTNKLIDDTKAKADKLLNGLQETGDNLSSTVKAKTDKIIEDTKAEVNNIKKDYEGLKKVIIDENIGIKLQKDVTELQNGLKSNQALAYQGSSISAENTLEGRTEEMKIKGKTLFNIHAKANYNFATNIPQENYTLSEGQNFCEVTIKKYPSSSYYYINAGTINFDLLKPNQKYTLLAKATDGLYPSVMTGGYEFPLTSGGTSFKNGVATMTTNNLVNGSKGQILYINLNGGATYKQELRDVMIFEGDLSIIPGSYFEGIKSFGEAEQEGDKYKIKLLSKNKNFFNKETDLSNWWGSHGELHKGDSSGKKYSILTKAFSGFKYIINIDTPYSFYTFLDDKFNVLGYGEGKNTQVAPVGTTKLLWYLDLGGIDKGLYNKIQVEPGTISTEYQSYQEDKKDILIKEPLRSIGDFSDVMYEDNGQVKVYREAGQYTFTGEEAITKENTLTNITRFYIDIPCKNIINTRNIICNNFNSNGTWWDRDEIGMYWDTSIQGRLWFHIKNGEFNDFEAFRNFLKANPTTIVYQLATPITELYENCIDIDLDTYQDKTYFNILNSLPGTLDFKVPSNIGSVVQNMAKEVNNIWDVINNLLVPSLIETNKNIALATIKNNLK